jgi:undecaprenyl pyrophosphate phosphatase UppP
VAVTLGPPLLIVAALLLTGHNPTHAAQTGFVAALPIMVLALLLLLGVRRRRGPSQAGCHAALVAADHIREGSPPAD